MYELDFELSIIVKSKQNWVKKNIHICLGSKFILSLSLEKYFMEISNTSESKGGKEEFTISFDKLKMKYSDFSVWNTMW